MVNRPSYFVLCPRGNSNRKVPIADSKEGMGVSFQFRHSKDAWARPQSEQGSVDRHKECPSLWQHCSWGRFIICRIMVSFDVAQDRELVERPFHDLWTDGGETEKRLPCPPITSNRICSELWSYFWDTTLGFVVIFTRASWEMSRSWQFLPKRPTLLGKHWQFLSYYRYL